MGASRLRHVVALVAGRWAGTRARGMCTPASRAAERAHALITSIKKGDEDLARELLATADEPIELELTDPYGSTALTLASRGGHLELCRAILLLDPPPPVLNAQNIFGSTALMCASASGHAHVTSVLLERAGIDVNIQTQYGSTALSKAAEAGHAEIVAQLVARGAQLSTNKLGRTVHQLAEAQGHTHVLEALQQAKPPEQRNPVNSRPAHAEPASQPLVRAIVCGVRAGHIVCKLGSAVQGPPATIIAARGEGIPAMLPLNEMVLLRRDMSVKPQGWLIVERCSAETVARKQRCLHPRRPFDKKCVDCPDTRLL